MQEVELPGLPDSVHDPSNPDYNPFSDPASPYYRESGDFKPNRRNPLPARKCSKLKRNGEPCPNWAVAGTGIGGSVAVCYHHGGKLPNVRARADAVLEAARLQMTDSVPEMISVVHKLAVDADTPAQVKLNAAKDILDRVGLKAGADMTVDVNVNHVSASDKLAEKLSSLRKPEELEDLGEVDEAQ